MKTRHSFNRKQAQLCSEVEQIVSLVIGASHDERLQQLYVHSVEISKDGACLTVNVVPPNPLDAEAFADILMALTAAKSWIRQQVASEINRKRTPELRFQLLQTQELMAP
ncbi:MAG TPA: ribosome-binding factor A [Polyangiaceae bacterium]